ncbi:hypothetical protein DXG03_006617 [Asterophora parasitica]|uniref:Uncharacterized protein n=1 Tax=Asterophora parasitica TaxID=117018 RepID=A0A9P7G501_9AGAR|nr:hypothetical protein DXG03_006617 [Asterophora parasitica]
MPVVIPAFLIRSLRSLSQFMHKMSSPSTLPDPTPIEQYLFPRCAQASSWSDQLHLYKSHFAELLAGSFVHKLFFVKATFGLQHEYIIAEIHNRDDGVQPSVRFLRLERASGDLRTRDKANRGLQRSPAKRDSPAQAALDTVSDSSDSSKPHGLDAVDIITEYPGWVPRGLVYTITFPDASHAPSVEDLALAAYITSTFDEQYSLLLRQCYWWADTLMAITEAAIDEQYRVKERFSAELTQDKKKEYDFTKPTVEGSYQYKWVKVPVHIRNAANVEQLKLRFDVQKAHYADLAKAANDEAVAARKEAEEAKTRLEGDLKERDAELVERDAELVRVRAERDAERARTEAERARAEAEGARAKALEDQLAQLLAARV